jgi:hypothetical protein
MNTNKSMNKNFADKSMNATMNTTMNASIVSDDIAPYNNILQNIKSKDTEKYSILTYKSENKITPDILNELKNSINKLLNFKKYKLKNIEILDEHKIMYKDSREGKKFTPIKVAGMIYSNNSLIGNVILLCEIFLKNNKQPILLNININDFNENYYDTEQDYEYDNNNNNHSNKQDYNNLFIKQQAPIKNNNNDTGSSLIPSVVNFSDEYDNTTMLSSTD